MSISYGNVNDQYRVKDISHWEGRWELVEGIPHLIASPSRIHQTISRRLLTLLEKLPN